MVTVRELLELMNLANYTHVLIRRKLPMKLGFDYVGGGFQDRVIEHFGDLAVQRTVVCDNKLLIYVD